MHIGIFAGDVTGPTALARLVDEAVVSEAEGFHSFWLPWISAHDPMIALSLAGQRTSRIELGTAVMRTYPRHPADMAPAAVTAAVATGGRFVLGIGPSHKPLIEGAFGYSFAAPLRHTEEYLTVLTGLLAGETVHFSGTDHTSHHRLTHPDPPTATVPVVVAALGPKMLALAGRMTAGTFTWMTGPVTIGEHTVPQINAAAQAAGRPQPRAIVGAAVLVTDDVDAGRARAAEVFARYGALPSYRAMLDREGWAGPADAALVGDEATVAAALARFRDAGATDFAAVEFDEDPHARSRTRALLVAEGR